MMTSTRREQVRKALKRAGQEQKYVTIANEVGIDVHRLYTFISQGHLADVDVLILDEWLVSSAYLQPEGVLNPDVFTNDPVKRMMAGLNNMLLLLGSSREPLEAKLPVLRTSLDYLRDTMMPLLEEHAHAERE